MKLSVSVPDKLWFKARCMSPTLGPSEIVQFALETLTADFTPTDEQLRQYWDENQ